MTRFLLIVMMVAVSEPGRAGPIPGPRPPLHPQVMLLDAEGRPVIKSAGPVSTIRSCGTCHDTGYIAAHSYHASAGTDRPFEPGQAPSGRPWDLGAGLFGRWDALGHGPAGPKVDLKHWLATTGARHVGGGPAETLGVDMDCFLCHLPNPDLSARNRELQEGRFAWAATATLAATGVVKRTDTGWSWDPRAFDAEGHLTDPFPRPRPTTASNCGLCHGAVHQGTDPFRLTAGRGGFSTETKGQVFSSQMLKDSGLNLAGKDLLSRPFDIHAERLLRCADCHSTANNPAQFAAVASAAPKHLSFEPRRLSPGEYLARPDHNLAKGHTAQGTVARWLDGTMRRCEQCHDAEPVHTWLPYPRRHFQALSCEACHVARVFAPARERTDWTLIGPDGAASVGYRGAEGDPRHASTLLHGFTPVLMPREELDGSTRLTPHNLVTTWYWVAGEPLAPVALGLVRKAAIDGGTFHPDLMRLLDTNRDGRVDPKEARLDTEAKTEAMRSRLAALGVKDARIRGEVQPYGLHHGVATGNWAVRECIDCHGPASRVTAPIELAEYVPGGVLPEPLPDANVRWNGRMGIEDGRLVYRPATAPERLHVIGRDHWETGDAIGMLAVAGSIVAVVVHGGLRTRAARKAR
ncbi:MAG: hypothetical protein U0794_02165 [Isosphaeraceae bacterium]